MDVSLADLNFSSRTVSARMYAWPSCDGSGAGTMVVGLEEGRRRGNNIEKQLVIEVD